MNDLSLAHLREKLQTLMAVDKAGDLRPFVCEGNPFDHRIFLVGLNPVTAIESYWGYWDDSYGFHKEAWLETYMRKKAEQGKQVTPTRRYLNLIAQAAGVPCLETDIYSKPTKKLRDLPDSERKTDIFDCLVSAIRPRIMLVYGKEAINHIQRHIESELTLEQFHDVEYKSINMSIYPCRHLAAVGWSNDKAASVGRQMGELICL